MNNNDTHWWPICVSDTITANSPSALFFGNNELAVYRDKSNTVRAVEDRCPHRRAPLSLGRVTTTGHLQCGYHGWTFNGETGQISGFPNLDEGERLPQCAIKAYAIREHQGVVYIANNPETNPDHESTPLVSLGEHKQLAAHLPRFTSQAIQGLSHQETVIAFLDNPELFLNITGVEVLEKSYGNPKVVQGLVQTQRAARWNLLGESRFYLGPLRHRADFPLVLKTLSVPTTGESLITVSRQGGEILAEIHLTFTAAIRGMTALHSQGTINPDHWGLLTPLLAVQRWLNVSPINLKQSLNGLSLAKMLPTMGEDWAKASAVTTQQPSNQEDVC